jgi:hypothetical protein
MLLSSSYLAGICVCKIQRAMGVDGGENAVSVHLVGGVWGIISPGLLAASPGYGKTYAGTMAPQRLLLLCIYGWHSKMTRNASRVSFSLSLPMSLTSQLIPQIPTISKTLGIGPRTARECSTVSAVLCSVELCRAVLCSVVQCCVVLCTAVLCCVALCSAVSCSVVLCRAVLCCVLLCIVFIAVQSTECNVVQYREL